MTETIYGKSRWHRPRKESSPLPPLTLHLLSLRVATVVSPFMPQASIKITGRYVPKIIKPERSEW